MNKKIIVAVLLSLFSFGAHAQYVFDEGNVAVNLGIGFISNEGVIPSFNLSAELGLIPTGDVGIISVGGAFEWKYSKINEFSYNQLTAGTRAAWHLQKDFLNKSNFDLYGGLGLGLRLHKTYSFSSDNLKPKLSPYLETFVGGRMMIDNNLGFFLEIGGGAIASAKAGIVYRL